MGTEAFHRPNDYPRTSTYDPQWIIDLDMGPNPLWLLEDLASELQLRPGMRVLDLGSGRGATSVFLAREFGVEVVACDHWIPAQVAASMFEAAGVADRVTAVNAEAHNLPFERDFFDAVVSVDAFEYFGTADTYLHYMLRFLRPEGQLGIATPALRTEIRDLGAIPPYIKELVGWEAIAWHTVDWWRWQWEITEKVTVTSARFQDRGFGDWLLWARTLDAQNPGSQTGTLTMLERDNGDLISFALLTAIKRETAHL